MVKKLSDAAPFAMRGFEFAMAVAIALFLIASAMGNFLALPSALAAMILSLLCLPVIVMLYWSEDDAALRKTFLGMIICFVIQTVSGQI
jgi:Na+/citrate or Na+/malate symporter